MIHKQNLGLGTLWGLIYHETQTTRDQQDMLGTVGEVRTKLISDILLWTPIHRHTSGCQPAKTSFIISVDIGWCQEELLGDIADRDWWWESQGKLLSACLDDDFSQ